MDKSHDKKLRDQLIIRSHRAEILEVTNKGIVGFEEMVAFYGKANGKEYEDMKRFFKNNDWNRLRILVRKVVGEKLNGELYYECSTCDNTNISELRPKEEWQKKFVGKKIDKEKALLDGWHDQGSENFLFGVKQHKNLWAKIMKPLHSSCHEILIFLILKVNNNLIIKDVDFKIAQLFPDGHSEIRQGGLFHDDKLKASEEIERIIENQN